MNSFKLSYVITTRNKLIFLKHTMKRLLDNLQQDEEIVVIDGASSDGTVEYLTELYRQGSIHQFITEKDRGESNGFNKGFLIAKGELIKVITDDDCFNYPVIQECKNFMLEHKKVDLMIGNTFNTSLENFDDIECQKTVEENYTKWIKEGGCFPFTGLSLMIRKSSLAFVGLFDCSTSFPDNEFSLRVTSLGANIAWHNGVVVIRIDNPSSNMRSFETDYILSEVDRFNYFYDKIYRAQKNNLSIFLFRYSKLKLRKIYCAILYIKNRLMPTGKKNIYKDKYIVNSDALNVILTKCENFFVQFNTDNGTTCTYPKNNSNFNHIIYNNNNE